jgi:DNA-binding transcriptional LysR family regulator
LLQRHDITPFITQEVGEAMTIIGLVSAGLGVSILPASFKRVRISEVVWLPIEEPEAQSEMWLVWPKHRELSAAALRISALLTESITRLKGI